jgi:hypothetical protein
MELQDFLDHVSRGNLIEGGSLAALAQRVGRLTNRCPTDGTSVPIRLRADQMKPTPMAVPVTPGGF